MVRVGAGAEGIAVDPASGVAAIATDAGLALVDAATGEPRTVVELPAPARHVSFSGTRFLVPLEEANQLAEVSPDGERRLTDTGAHPHDAAADADGRIFVGDEFAASLSVLSGGRLTRTVKVAEQPGGVVVTGDVVAVVSVRANVVETYDRRTLERLSTQNVGYGPSHVVADAQGRLYVADTRGGGISVFSTRPRLRFEQRIETGGQPYGIAVDGDRLWVTLSDRNQLLQIEGGRVVKTFPTSGDALQRGRPSRRGAGHRPRRRGAADRQSVRTVPSSIVAGPVTFTEPRATTSAPNVTSPSTSKRSASFRDTGPFGNRASKSRMSL